MTVHASKGLEFPVVFVVNMARGASGPPRPMRILVSADDEPSVSIGPFVSDLDEAERVREQHESRRLLYVALTRARDRLYLSSSLKEGEFAPGRGGLAEVLPPSIGALFARAASAFPECPAVAWTSASGRTYEFRICRPAAGAGMNAPAVIAPAVPRPGIFDATPQYPSRPPGTVTEVAAGAETRPAAVSARDAAVGVLVHRLLSLPDRRADAGPATGVTVAAFSLAREELTSFDDPEEIVAAALDTCRRVRERPDVRDLLAEEDQLHEVPFSMLHNGVVVRGSIDWVVRKPDGSVIVVELKTGGEQPWHRIQLDLYVSAVRSMFPKARVEGRLIYA
jgi:ATP-dependent helicase/nuclease subunit A